MSQKWVSRRPTKGLFKQFNPSGTEDLNKWRETFVEIADPTEYAGALELVGTWDEWQRFKREWPHFRNEILPSWLAEVEVKIRSIAIRSLCGMAIKEVAAARFIAEGKFNPAKAGRPSKAEVERQAKIQARLDNEVDDDIARVQQTHSLKVIDGTG